MIASLHNLALVCLLVQLCLVYGANFYNKLLGETWIDGTALGIVFRLADYGPPVLAGFLAGNRFFQASAGYFTLAFEGAFPLLIWSRKGRVAAVVLAVLLHGGTILFMGLVAFGFRMIVYQTVLLSDDQYLWLGCKLRSARSPKVRAARFFHARRRPRLKRTGRFDSRPATSGALAPWAL